MAVIEIKADPSRTELRVFALMWLVFVPLLGYVLPRADSGVLVLAGVATLCLALSLALNRDEPRRRQLLGLALPAVLISIWGAMALWGQEGAGRRVVPGVILGTAVVLGAAGSIATLASKPLGARLYRAWMLGVMPIGWTVSHLLLAAVFFGVVTPVGLLLRLLGRDLLQRGADPGADTYWQVRERVDDPRRYMRQF
jgi:hypothetical protein